MINDFPISVFIPSVLYGEPHMIEIRPDEPQYVTLDAHRGVVGLLKKQLQDTVEASASTRDREMLYLQRETLLRKLLDKQLLVANVDGRPPCACETCIFARRLLEALTKQ